ncbi:head GIN domain-containing protein [Algoriphagus zhangzhouensis]|uniref:Putative auto-transporter adhesin, head GIN domain n=1 Tax=Algoriphagus zhangzhouensis TaxID=1073327 RepID=A0A1M7ZCC1_9BACT|nr:head GIN domain-containing protein [Algoriphagus zhangzhouensis]TDY45517.1 putative autotransporter adhesin-like protein [Algoriphagus zhangzhouensis]SHO62492.1 Putative auto-transporter adhesin, head GIN domain [Algoriphagus zhangzhouensis]
MKINTKIAAVILMVFGLGSCVQAQQTETRTPGHFTKVHSGGSWEVILTEGNKEEIRIEAKGVSLDKVKTEIDGDVLEVGLVRGSYNNVKLKFYITYRELEGVRCSGSGEMEVTSPVEASEFYIGLSGSGDIIMNTLEARELEASISGSAEIKIKGGSVDEAEIKQSGSGDFLAENLAIGELNVSKSGSGDTEVGDLGEISVRSSGSGDIIYSGSPRMGEVRVSGSSSIRKR